MPPEGDINFPVSAPSPTHSEAPSASSRSGKKVEIENQVDLNPFSSMAMKKDVTFGISKLKFIKMSDLEKVSAEASAVAEKRNLKQPTLTRPGSGSVGARPLVYASDEKSTLAFSYSETTCLSTRTNMKYMNIGNIKSTHVNVSL